MAYCAWQAAGSLGLTRGPGGAAGGNPFFRLLRAYLQHFMPRPAPGAPTLQRPSGGPLINTSTSFLHIVAAAPVALLQPLHLTA